MLYYLDSSAWVKRYFDEAGSSRVRQLFAQHETLGCSPLGLIEVGSTMARKRTAEEVKPEEFEGKRTSLLKDWRHFLRMEMTAAVVERALDASDTYGLRGADSVHFGVGVDSQGRTGVGGPGVRVHHFGSGVEGGGGAGGSTCDRSPPADLISAGP